VQDVTALSEGQLKMTISKFYRVSGDSTQHRGVIPDIAFPSLHDIEKIGESEQDNALPWDRIHRVPHQAQDQLSPLIKPLTKSHLARRSADPDLASLVEKIELSDTWGTQKSLSLNMNDRRARSERWDMQLYTLENRRLVAKGQDPFADLTAWKDSDKDDEEISDSEASDQSGEDLESNQENGDTATDLALDDAKGEEEDEDIVESDPMLLEAGKVLSEQIQLQTQANSRRLALMKKIQETNL
jgi:carboxyl-terminal processing protease